MESLLLQNFPGGFEWKNNPLDWKLVDGNNLSITAGKNTDWFIDPSGSYTRDNAPVALFSPQDPNFILSAKVKVNFASTFDAGVIQVRVRDDLWAKLCFEYSPQNHPMIVSVVTRGVSDDCNSVVINGNEVFLRIAKTPQTFSFHYSIDGKLWHLVRYFFLDGIDNLRVGFSSQSPTGDSCTSVFSEINYRAETLKDNRNGE